MTKTLYHDFCPPVINLKDWLRRYSIFYEIPSSERALNEWRPIRRRLHLRALAQRIEVDVKEVRIMGSKSVLLRTLVAASGANTAGFGVPSFVPKWRPRQDSNLRPSA
jgi:hypothetical protein